METYELWLKRNYVVDRVVGETESPMLKAQVREIDTKNMEVDGGDEEGMEEVVVAEVVGMESKLVTQQDHLEFESKLSDSNYE